MAKSKRELDKDLMFQKIMPALSENPFTAGNSPKGGDSQGEENVSVLRSKLFARREDYEEGISVATVNAMEEYVLRHVDAVMKRFRLCKCDKCRCDVVAYALNNLSPVYVDASTESVISAIKDIPQSTVLNMLVKAALHVRSNPNH